MIACDFSCSFNCLRVPVGMLVPVSFVFVVLLILVLVSFAAFA